MALFSSLLDKFAPARPLRAGDRAPDFTLRDSQDQPVTLAEALAEGPVLLAFYPRAFTYGCTHELRRYTERQEELRSKGAQLFAISVDDPATLARFKSLLGATFTFLSDPDGKVSQRYAGVTSSGEANRTTVSVGPDGKITRVTAGVSALFPGGDIVACTQAGVSGSEVL
jgi:thioredoxin-dependent peroxiredoxin